MHLIVPPPKRAEFGDQKSKLSFPLSLHIPEKLGIGMQAVQAVCPGAFSCAQGAGNICFEYQSGLENGYRIISGEDQIVICHENGAGAFYALVTLWQIFQSGAELTLFLIEDQPDLQNRGFMLDISRGRVPKKETVKQLADILARFKYNQLQLYIEGFSFGYPGFLDYCDKDRCLTPEEIREIEDYCRKRFIELVPNQNSLGHMTSWLSKSEFAHLAECEGGFSYGNVKLPATTLDAADEESLALVRRMAEDLMECFSSDKIHLGLDEPFEMGKGKNKGRDLAKLFLEYVCSLDRMCGQHGKKMMMWADALHRFDCFAYELPEDVIYLEWGYEKEHPFEQRCRKLQEKGLHFYVCPGTSGWQSFTGLTDNMIANIDRAIESAASCKADGVLLTEWGDCSHLQPMAVSYAPIVYCGASGWNGRDRLTEQQLRDALDHFVFEDSRKVMGNIALEAGRYHLLEELQIPCKTLAHYFYSENIKSRDRFEQALGFTERVIRVLNPPEVASAYLPMQARIDAECIDNVLQFIERLRGMLSTAEMKCEDAKLITKEYENAFDMIRLFTLCRRYLSENKPLSGLHSDAAEILAQHEKLRLCRGKNSGLEAARAAFEDF